MTTKQLNYKALPIIAAADGATSPALTASDKGAMAWSTTTNKPMSWDGTKWNLLTKVDSVAGRTGAVTLTKTDIGLGSVDDVSAASLRDRTTHTGVQAISSVTGLQTALDGKASTGHSHSDVTITSNGFMTSADKVKLDGIVPANLLSRANHTGTQTISTIDTLQSTLDTKASTGHSHTEATVSAKGFMSSADKAKLDGIVTANLLDRANHTGAQAISTITGLQTAIDGRASSGHSHSEVTTSAGGFMSSADKTKLDGIVTTNLLNRANHTGAQDIATVTGLQGALDTKASTGHTHSNATTTVAGFMSNTDKSKLDGVATGATAYVHPANHPASIITQDASNRFVTDTEKAAWNAKQNAGSYALDSHSHTAFPTNLTIDNQLRLGNGGGRVYSNSAFGANALMLNTTGSANTAIGLNSMYTNTTGGNNTALGQLSLYSNTSGTQNVAIGVSAMYTNSTGAYNTAVGLNALNKNDLGSGNTAVGCAALLRNVGGTSNNSTAVGWSALSANTMGSSNTAIGASALQYNTIGMSNTALGNGAMLRNISGESNTAIGINALSNNTSGFGNIAVGGNSSSGAYAPVFNPTTESNRVVMGSTAVTNAYIQVAWTVVSDARDKTNFKAIPHGLDFVKQLKPTAYQFRTDRGSEETNGGVRYGFKAQDIAAIEPEAVIVDTTNPEKLYYNESNLIPILVKAIQELSAEVERLKNANPNY